MKATQHTRTASVKWAAVGFFALALGVAAGAFGAHGLKPHLEAAAMEQWLTAVRYWTLASVAVVLLSVLPGRDGVRPQAVVAAGAVVFSAAVGGLALGGPRWLGALAPLGGASMILGMVLAGLFLWRRGV